jgi:molybdenum cofactor cytidylyltransferase
MSAALPRHGVVVLAAGASRRLARSKQLLLIDGEPLVRRATRAALATDPAQAVVVVGADANAVFAAIADLAVERVECDDWAQGMGASLRAGTRALHDGLEGLLVVLCDQPSLTAAHLQRLVLAWRLAPAKAVASRYAQTSGVPAILPRTWFADLLLLDSDQGARDLLRHRADEVVGIAAPELARDIDHPGDIR